MARGHAIGDGALFFAATLILWAVSVAFEMAFNGRRELMAVVAGFSFYQAANWALRSSLSRDPLFVNTAVSLLHSTITSASVVLILANQGVVKGFSNMFEHAQLFGGTWLGAYSALCFSCGYFAYDQWDMIRYRLYSGWIPSILVHHLILLVCFTMALYRNVTINYLILTLVCELHSIFLHVRKVRRMAGIRETKCRIIGAEWMLNWATFLSFGNEVGIVYLDNSSNSNHVSAQLGDGSTALTSKDLPLGRSGEHKSRVLLVAREAVNQEITIATNSEKQEISEPLWKLV